MKQIFYKSTRGDRRLFTSSQAILQGISEDGGLFVPDSIPDLTHEINSIVDMNYKELSYLVMSKFFTDFDESELRECVGRAYDSKFDTENIVELKKVSNVYFMELYHGPTLAFKDMALSILPYLMKVSAKKNDFNKDILILTATSGDTGKAALESFSGVDRIKIIVLFPKNGVSKIQEMQMVTQEGDNTCVIGLNGNFDDAQTGVKNIFKDSFFNKKLFDMGYVLSSANSINIGRLIPQIVYYFYGYASMVKNGQIDKNEKINVVVPTGNFGNILAAYYAKSMGLPIKKLICASNDNNVLTDFINKGIYDKNRDFFVTISPSMDILISSNLERLLYLISDCDCSEVKQLMNSLNTNGEYSISQNMKDGLRDFYGNFATQKETLDSIKEIFDSDKYLIDTHTAVAYSVYKKYLEETNDNTKVLIASTASPYKFTKFVMKALDSKYSYMDDFSLIKEMNKIGFVNIPDSINDLENKEILHKIVCDKNQIRTKILDFLNNYK